MLEDRGLADTRFAAHHERPAAAGLRLSEQVFDGLALCAPAQEVGQFRSARV